MGKMKGNGYGLFTGKMGSVVGYYNKQFLIRSKPVTVSNPKTPAQVLQRNKFNYVLQQLKPLYANIPYKYGSYRGNNFNKLMQMYLKSPIGCLFGNPVKNHIVVSGYKPVNYSETVAMNNDKEGLNIFTSEYLEISETGNQISFKGAGTEPDTPCYFGMDYRLPEKIGAICLQCGSIDEINTFVLDNTATLSFNLINTPAEMTTVKTKGIQLSLEACGAGWKYYYKTEAQVLTNWGRSYKVDRAIFPYLDGYALRGGVVKGFAAIFYNKDQEIQGDTVAALINNCAGFTITA